MATEAADGFSLQVNGGMLWLYGIDSRGMPVTLCLGEASRALGKLALSVTKLELSRSFYLLPRGH